MIGMFYWLRGKRWILLLLVVLLLFDTITSNVNATTVTMITAMPKGIQGILISKEFWGGRWTESQRAVCRQVVKRV